MWSRSTCVSQTIVILLAVLPLIQSLLLPTALNSSIHEPSANLTWSHKHCVRVSGWNPPDKELAPSCEVALNAFADDGLVWGPNTGTFTYSNGQGMARFPGSGKFLRLPKRFVYGGCVVAVVMMKFFEGKPQWQFPDLSDPTGGWSSEDRVTWVDMVEQIEYVRSTCVNGCGYAILGQESSIGVTTWATNCKWDKYVKRLEENEILGPDIAQS